MLEIIDLESWDDFENEIKSTINDQIDDNINANVNGWSFDPVLFRGQPNAKWELQTTLERHAGKNKPLDFYREFISILLPEIETFTGKKWDIDSNEEKDNELALDYDLPADVMRMLPLEYMTYLRHYGFPSPLLDWSSSPFVAAYFAFRDTANKAERVAIYEYRQIINFRQYTDPLEEAKKLKRPIITPLWFSEGIKNNKRHYLQQSIYTICINVNSDKSYFDNHENLYPVTEEELDSYKKFEYIKKYTLPSSERGNALLHLEMYNVNSFSLMGTEESLLETLFAKHVSRNSVGFFR